MKLGLKSLQSLRLLMMFVQCLNKATSYHFYEEKNILGTCLFNSTLARAGLFVFFSFCQCHKLNLNTVISMSLFSLGSFSFHQ